jgi:hypothetical protein
VNDQDERSVIGQVCDDAGLVVRFAAVLFDDEIPTRASVV